MKKQQMENKRIAFVYDKLHPLHEKFFKKIGCDFISLSKKLPPKYEIYVVEGTYIKPILLRKIGKIPKRAKIITLFSDPRLFYLYVGKRFNLKKEKMVKYSLLRSIIAKKLIKELDGAICTSNLTARLFRLFNKKAPFIVTHGFVFNENAKKIENAGSDLNSKNILFIGHGPDYYVKGIDLMVKSFKEVKKEFPDANLYVLGRWKERKEWFSEGVYFEGEQNIIEYLKKCSLSIHLGRGESFGINILETMLAGIPTLVSKYTGAKDIVEKVDKDFVVSLDENKVSKKIIEYFKTSLKRKQKISEKCKIVSRELNEQRMLEDFEKKFWSLMKSVK